MFSNRNISVRGEAKPSLSGFSTGCRRGTTYSALRVREGISRCPGADLLKDLPVSNREKFLNPISGAPSKPSSEEIDERIEERLKKFIQSEGFKEACLGVLGEVPHLNDNNNFKSTIVENEEEIIKLSNKRYDCQPLGNEKWLMKKEIEANLMLDIDNETCLVKELCYSKEN